jgi:hypothetical protein
MDDGRLLDRQESLQREAAAKVAELDLLALLGRAGRVVPLGSAVSGLMVWRDLDFGVDAPGLDKSTTWEIARPLLLRCSALTYADEAEDARHYFVFRLDGWKLDISIWIAGMPEGIESFQDDFLARLTDDLRVTILRLKDAWYTQPDYPDVVSAWQIYDAVLNHGARTLAGLDGYLAAHDLPTLVR